MAQKRNTPDNLRLRGRWVYGVRLFFITVFIFTVTIGSWNLPELSKPLIFFYYLCGVYSIITVLTLLLHDQVKRVRQFMAIQAVFDALFLLVMLYMTGGHQSLAIPMLDVHIVFAVFLLGRQFGRMLILLASTGVCVIGSIYLGQGEIPLEWVLPQWNSVNDLELFPTIGIILIDCASFIALGELSGQLSDLLNRARVLTRDVLDPLQQGVMVTSIEGEVLQMNPTFVRMTGCRLDLNNKHLSAGDCPEDILDLVFGEREDYIEIELEVNGELLSVECHALPMRDVNGHYLGMVVTLTDLSEHKEIELMKKQQQRSETIATLASGIAHEVRNPLAAMRSALQILGEAKSALDEDQKRMLDLIVREGDRLDNIVGSFLDFSKLKPRILAKTSLNDLTLETINLLNLDPRKGDIEIWNEIKGDHFAKIDPGQIKQVLLNLGINSFQAMTACGEGTKLIFRIFQIDFKVVIQVEDDGPGIPNEALGKLFDPFFTTKPEGTGMGLAVVDRIIRSHGGEITVRNLPEGGCRFDIEFPGVPT